jgi:hypothetical protein
MERLRSVLNPPAREKVKDIRHVVFSKYLAFLTICFVRSSGRT